VPERIIGEFSSIIGATLVIFYAYVAIRMYTSSGKGRAMEL